MQNNFTKEQFVNNLSIIFITCLCILVFAQIFSTSIFWFDIQNYELWAKILNNILAIQYGIIVFAIVSGSLLFYANKDKIESIEEEQEKELFEEEERKKEFGSKFPRVNKIPVVRGVVKWMYGEGVKGGLLLIWLWCFFISTIPDLWKDYYNDEFRWIGYPWHIDYTVVPDYLWQYNSSYLYSDTIVYFNSLLSLNLEWTTIVLSSWLTKIYTQLLAYPYFNLVYWTNTFSWNIYFFLSRLWVIIFNLISLFFIFWIIKKIFNKNIAYYTSFIILIFPLFQAYSRVVNHDSINGLLIVIPILWIIHLLYKWFNYKIAIISWIFYSLASFTSFKSYWLISLILLTPIIYFIIDNKITLNNISLYKNKLKYFFFYFTISFIISSFVISPLLLIYPEYIFITSVDKFLLINIILIFWLYYIDKIIKYKVYWKYFFMICLKLLSLLLFLYCIYILINKEYIYLNFVMNIESYKELLIIDFINLSMLNFIIFMPLTLFLIFFISLLYIIFKENSIIDFLLILSIYLFLMAIFYIWYVRSWTDIWIYPHLFANWKYLMVFYPLIIILLLLLFKNKYIIWLILFVSTLNFVYDKFESWEIKSTIIYQNQLFNKNILHYSEWFSYTKNAIDYINKNEDIFSNSNIAYYWWISSAIKEDLKNNTINITSRYWYDDADYLIIPYHFTLKYNTEHLQRYLNNTPPIWEVKKYWDTVIWIRKK